jgi:hypothetical protein
MTMRIGLFGGLAALAGVTVLAAVVGCSQSASPAAPRTMAQPQKLDVVCIQVTDSNGVALPLPQPGTEDNCSTVPANTSASSRPYHLYAVVTQRLRGELAVIDVTAGAVVDEDRTTPGVNFIPVGVQPTDVAVAPDGLLTFVSTAGSGMTGIDVIDNHHLLGDSAGIGQYPLGLSQLMGCSLPGVPMALSTVVDSSAASGYLVVVVLQGTPGSIVTIDPGAFAATAMFDVDAGLGAVPGGGAAPGAFSPCAIVTTTPLQSPSSITWTPGPPWPDGVPYADAGDLHDAEPSLGPTCSGGIAADAGAQAASTGTSAPQTLTVAASGIAQPSSMVIRNDDTRIAYVADGTLPIVHVINLTTPSEPQEYPPLMATRSPTLTAPAQAVPVGWLALSPPTRDYKRYLYAIDQSDGSIMVFDVTDPDTSSNPALTVPLTRPHAELNPLIPVDRLKFSAPAASVVFAQHDWPLLSPVNTSNTVNEFTGLLCNPNPNAWDSDAGTFHNDLGAYYRTDQTNAVQTQEAITQTFPYRLRGVFAFVMLSNGHMVVVDVDDWDAPCRRPDPMSSDPDAGGGQPGVTTGMTGQLDIPEPYPSNSNDLDPYHAPLVYDEGDGGISSPSTDTTGVTLEAFFPVSAPNRVRSSVLLAQNLGGGSVIPALTGQPQLFDVNGAPLPNSLGPGKYNPLLLAAPLSPGYFDPYYVENSSEPNPNLRVSTSSAGTTPASLPPPSVRISYEDPTVHQSQDWTVTYEGVLPSTLGISADLLKDANGEYDTLTLGGIGGMCSRGVEDWDIGQARAAEFLHEASRLGLPVNLDAGAPDASDAGGAPSTALSQLGQWTSDYVEITDDLLASGDAYWTLASNPDDTDATGDNSNDCWNGLNDGDFEIPSPKGKTASSVAADRYNFCFATFDAAVNADTHFARDFPILQAYDGQLIIGRFGWGPPGVSDAGTPLIPETTTNRVVVGADPSNAPFLKQLRCCFHRQAAFKVRTGGEWVAVGTENIGLLHHVVADWNNGGRCILSCDPQNALLNSRAFGVPWPDAACTPPPSDGGATPTPPSGLDRNSPLAMRNPMFSFVEWAGCPYNHAADARDSVWKFTISPGFSPLTVSIGQYATSPASPQSMRFVNSLGQIAVVDGSLQGVVFYDLNTISVGSGPYY